MCTVFVGLGLLTCMVAEDVTFNEKLQAELCKMRELDQEIHGKLVKDGGRDQNLIKEMKELSRKQTTRLKEIVKEHGWPTPALVGEDGANAAFAVVQHADHDRNFQKQCLALMEKAYKSNQLNPGYFAALTDYLRIAQKRKQLYGTQFVRDPKTGDLSPYPIEDEKNVDKRRAEIGLPSLEEHKEMIKEGRRPGNPTTA